jgi:hypothetical protein
VIQSAKEAIRAALIRELRLWRVRRGLTQREVAERFGVSRITVATHYRACALGTLVDLFESAGGRVLLDLQGPPGAQGDPLGKRMGPWRAEPAKPEVTQ